MHAQTVVQKLSLPFLSDPPVCAIRPPLGVIMRSKTSWLNKSPCVAAAVSPASRYVTADSSKNKLPVWKLPEATKQIN